MVLKLKLELPEERSFVRVTRQMGRTFLRELRVVEQDIDEVELIIGELCTNAIRHAHSDEHRFTLSLELATDHVVVCVMDRGPGFDPAAIAVVGAERADFDAGEKRIGGYGLHIVEQLTSRLEFHRLNAEGTMVRAEKQLHILPPITEHSRELAVS